MMRRIKDLRLILALLPLIELVTFGFGLPSSVLCANEKCDKEISQAEVIKNVPVSETAFIPKAQKISIYAKALDNMEWKIYFNNEFHYIDSSFLHELSTPDTANLRRVQNPDHRDNLSFSSPETVDKSDADSESLLKDLDHELHDSEEEQQSSSLNEETGPSGLEINHDQEAIKQVNQDQIYSTNSDTLKKDLDSESTVQTDPTSDSQNSSSELEDKNKEEKLVDGFNAAPNEVPLAPVPVSEEIQAEPEPEKTKPLEEPAHIQESPVVSTPAAEEVVSLKTSSEETVEQKLETTASQTIPQTTTQTTASEALKPVEEVIPANSVTPTLPSQVTSEKNTSEISLESAATVTPVDGSMELKPTEEVSALTTPPSVEVLPETVPQVTESELPLEEKPVDKVPASNSPPTAQVLPEITPQVILSELPLEEKPVDEVQASNSSPAAQVLPEITPQVTQSLQPLEGKPVDEVPASNSPPTAQVLPEITPQVTQSELPLEERPVKVESAESMLHPQEDLEQKLPSEGVLLEGMAVVENVSTKKDESQVATPPMKIKPARVENETQFPGLGQCLNRNMNRLKGSAHEARFTSLLASYFLTNLNLVESVTSRMPGVIIGPLESLFNSQLHMDLDNTFAWAAIVFQLWLLKLIIGFTSDQFLGSPVNSARIKGSQAEIFALEEKLRELSSLLNAQKSENLRLQVYSGELNVECTQLRADLVSAEKSCDTGAEKMRQELDEATRELADLRASHDAVADEFAHSRRSWEETEEQIVQQAASVEKMLKEELQKSRVHFEETQASNKKMLQDLETERKQLYDQANDYYERMMQMQSEVDKYSQSKEKLERELQTKCNEYNALCESLNHVKQAQEEMDSEEELQEVEEQVQSTRIELQDYDTDEEVEESTTDEEGADEENGWEEEGWNEVETSIPKRKIVKRLVRVTKQREVSVPVMETVKKLVPVAKAKKSSVTAVPLNQLLDVSRLKTELAEKEQKLYEAENASKREQTLREEIETRMQQFEWQKIELQSAKEKAEQDKLNAENKLEILSQYFKERELQLQTSLVKENRNKDENISQVESYKEKCDMFETETKVLREQISSLKKELTDSERSWRRQLTGLDKRAHENWLAARTSENLLRELREENTSLRLKFQQEMLGANQRRLRIAPSSNSTTGKGIQLAMMGSIPPPPPPPMPFPTCSPGRETVSSRQSNGTAKSDSNRLFPSPQMTTGLIPPPPPPFPMMSGNNAMFAASSMNGLGGSPRNSAGNSVASDHSRRRGKHLAKSYR